MSRGGPNSKTKNKHKRALARRDGTACAYCHTRFPADLSGATLEHVVPYALFRTWGRAHMTLACLPCSAAKANRLPLLLALLLLATTGPGPVCGSADRRTLARLAHVRQSADRLPDPSAARRPAGRPTPPPTAPDPWTVTVGPAVGRQIGERSGWVVVA